MKRLLLTITLLLIGLFIQAQTDIEIVEALIGKPFSKMESILKEMGLTYYVTSDKDQKATIYIEKENSIRLWDIQHNDLYRTSYITGEEMTALAGSDLMIEIFVRYRHSNLYDLREFYEYEIPENNEYREYEKELGSKVSHLRVKQN